MSNLVITFKSQRACAAGGRSMLITVWASLIWSAVKTILSPAGSGAHHPRQHKSKAAAHHVNQYAQTVEPSRLLAGAETRSAQRRIQRARRKAHAPLQGAAGEQHDAGKGKNLRFVFADPDQAGYRGNQGRQRSACAQRHQHGGQSAADKRARARQQSGPGRPDRSLRDGWVLRGGRV